jgi:hypothetical protein
MASSRHLIAGALARCTTASAFFVESKRAFRTLTASCSCHDAFRHDQDPPSISGKLNIREKVLFFFFFVLFYCVETGLLEARYRSFVDAFCAILKEEGPAGFFRGLSAKLLYKVHNQVLKSSCSAAGIWVPFSDPAARHQQAPSVLDAMNC